MYWRGFQLGFNKKLLLIYTSILVASLLLAGQALHSLHLNLVDDRRQKIRQLVESTHSLVDHYYQQSQAGLAPEVARKKAKEALRNLRYGHFGYFWVNDLETRVLVHPAQPHLENARQLEHQDSRGQYIFRNFVTLAKSSEQAGYLRYYWPKPGGSEPIEKLSYVKLYEPWGWVLGSGIYLDDIHTIFWAEVKHYAWVLILLLAIIGYLVWNILRVDAKVFQSNQLMASVVEACGEALLVTDRDTRIVWANSAFERLTGYSPEEIKGLKPCDIMQSGQQSTAFYDELWQQLLQGNYWSGELINRKKNGALYHEQMSITPVLDRKGLVSHYVAVKKDITQQKEVQQRLHEQANQDSLTKLPNRRSFMKHLEEHLQKQKADKGVLILLDLDYFKRINDTHGHPAGDQVLVEFAQRMQVQLRKEDFLGRIGGEEFALLAPGLSASEGLKLAQRLCDSFKQKPMQINSLSLAVTTSLGLTAITETDQTTETLLVRADKGLYLAKQAGRACAHLV